MTKKRRIIVAISATIVAALAIWVLVPVQPVELKVTISLDSATFRDGDPIMLHATITNEGEEPVKILEPSLADMTFDVVVFDEQGSRQKYLGPGSLKEMDRDAGRYLDPGEKVSLEVPLHNDFELTGGQYRVVAAYRTLNYPDFEPYCKIDSNEVYFSVISSD